MSVGHPYGATIGSNPFGTTAMAGTPGPQGIQGPAGPAGPAGGGAEDLTDLIVTGSRWIERVHAFLTANVSNAFDEREHLTGGGKDQVYAHDAGASCQPWDETLGSKLLSANAGNTVSIVFGDEASRTTLIMHPRGAYSACVARLKVVALNSGLDFRMGAEPVAGGGCLLRLWPDRFAIFSGGAERADITALHPDNPAPDSAAWHTYLIATQPLAGSQTRVRVWGDPTLPGYAANPAAWNYSIDLPNAEVGDGNLVSGLTLNNPGSFGGPVTQVAWSQLAVFWPAV